MNGRPVDPDLEKGLTQEELNDVSRRLVAYQDGVNFRAKILKHTLLGGSCLVAIGTAVFYLRGVGTLPAGLPVPVPALSALSLQASNFLDTLRKLLDREHCLDILCVLDLKIGATIADISGAVEKICGNLCQKAIDSIGQWTNSTERRDCVGCETLTYLLLDDQLGLSK